MKTAKEARWEAQRQMARLSILPVDVGLVGWAVNVILRRPSDFPTVQFARFRREILKQASVRPLSGADCAVVKMRARLLGSPIDARASKPLTGVDVDAIAEAAVERARAQAVVDLGEATDVFDAVWGQVADAFGSPARGRAEQLDAAGVLPDSGAALSRALRSLEEEHVRAARAYRTER